MIISSVYKLLYYKEVVVLLLVIKIFLFVA